LEQVKAGPLGRLYSHSTVHVGEAAPYTLGYVDLEGGPRVIGLIETDEPESVPCDVTVLLLDGDPALNRFRVLASPRDSPQ
jgi:uncharacterized OB-fold protein